MKAAKLSTLGSVLSIWATATVAGCDISSVEHRSIRADDGGTSTPSQTPPVKTYPCLTDMDCRSFSDYCTGCDCRALGTKEGDPVCNAPGVECFVDPCFNKAPVCTLGRCALVVNPTPAPVACGKETCAPGLVCCNASCGTCVSPGASCIQQACDPPAPTACRIDADCRTFSDYCTGCDCRALIVGEKDPVCSGPGVRCLADPCMAQKATCQGNRCTLTALPQGCLKRTQGGDSSCKSQEVWTTYATEDCRTVGLVLSESTLRESCGSGLTRFVDYLCC